MKCCLSLIISFRVTFFLYRFFLIYRSVLESFGKLEKVIFLSADPQADPALISLFLTMVPTIEVPKFQSLKAFTPVLVLWTS